MGRYKNLIIVFLVGFIVGQWSGGCRRESVRSYSPPTTQGSVAVGPAHSRSAPAKGEIVLGDFESDRELDGVWKTRSVRVERSSEHATRGKYSAKLTYLPADGASAFMVEGALRSLGAQDWRRFAKLKFDLYNPSTSQIRVIFQLKDGEGQRYKEDIYLQPQAGESISIAMKDLEGYLNLSRIVQFNLFQWKPRSRSEVFLDYVRLVPPGLKGEIASPRSAELAMTSDETSAVRDSTKGSDPGWQVAWETSLQKVFREPDRFEGHASNPVQFMMARHEYESAQVVLQGGVESVKIQADWGDLVHANGVDWISKEALTLRRVDYVETKKPFYPVKWVGHWPDALPEASKFEIEPGTLQPIWVTVYASQETVPGDYRGKLILAGSDGQSKEVELKVRVWDFTLPITPTLKTAFDFYRGRLAKAYKEFVPEGAAWLNQIDGLQHQYFLSMLEHRIFPIWGANPKNPRFAWDVKEYLEQGLGVFGVGINGGDNEWPKDPEGLSRVSDEYFQIARDLKSYQLLDHTYVYTYDEPKPGDPHVAQVMAAIHEADPGLKNLLVMHEAPNPEIHAEWLKDADILCIRNAALNPGMADRYRQLGKEIWMYVSSPSHPFPTLVIDHPAINARILPWMCWKYDITGLLYWCVNFWEGDPMVNPASFAKDQNGNGYLFYPGSEGPIPSIRLAVLRDGMEDYEYLFRLNKLIEQARGRGGVDPTLLERAEKLVAVDEALVESLRTYSKDPAVLLQERKAIAETIMELQAQL